MLKLIAKDLHSILDLEDFELSIYISLSIYIYRCSLYIYIGAVEIVHSDFGEGLSFFCNYCLLFFILMLKCLHWRQIFQLSPCRFQHMI